MITVDDLITHPDNRLKLLDAPTLAVLGVPGTTLAWWVREGWITPAGRRGKRHLYRLGDVLDMKTRACPVQPRVTA